MKDVCLQFNPIDPTQVQVESGLTHEECINKNGRYVDLHMMKQSGEKVGSLNKKHHDVLRGMGHHKEGIIAPSFVPTGIIAPSFMPSMNPDSVSDQRGIIDPAFRPRG